MTANDPNPGAVTVPVTTQQAYPGRAVLRTVVQVLVAAPLILTVLAGVLTLIAGDPFGAQFLPDAWVAWLFLASGFTAALAGLLAKIMAMPYVDRALQAIRLGSAPYVARHKPTPGD